MNAMQKTGRNRKVAICVLLLGGIAGCTNRFEQAEQLCDHADADMQRDAFQVAAQKYSAVISLNPDLPRAYLGRGMALHGMNEFGNAIADYNEYLRRAAATPEVLFTRGTAYQSVGELGRAASDYQRVSQMRPDFAPAFFSMGTVAQSRGELADALQWYEEAIALDPENANAIFSRDSVLEAMKLNEQAKSDGAPAVEVNLQSVDAFLESAMIFQDDGELSAAIEEFTRVIAIQPRRLSARYQRALAYHKSDREEEAIGDLEVVLRYDRRHADALLLRGHLQVELYVQADSALDSSADESELLNSAITDYSQFIKLRPDAKIGYDCRAQAYELAGNRELAEVDRRTSRSLGSRVK